MASPNADFPEIVTTTLKKRSKKLADNVSNSNALLSRLMSRGNIKLVDGGQTLVEELEYAENSTFEWYSGWDTLNVNTSDVFTAAEFDWKQAAVSIVVSGLQLRQNSGTERIIPLLDKKIRNGEKTMKNNVSTGIYSDGTGAGGLQVGGLQLLVPDDPTVGTVGGINRATYSFWRSNKYAGVADGGGAVSAANIQDYMNATSLLVQRFEESADLIVADSTYWNFYLQSLQAIQRITGDSKAAAGFKSLAYNGGGRSTEVVYDSSCPAAHMYFLNTDYLFFKVHKDANFAPQGGITSNNQDGIADRVLFMGNMTLSNAKQQAVLIA